MAQDHMAAAIFIYGIGAIITIMAADDFAAFNRRVFLWPVYWLYLLASALVFLWSEVNRK